MSELLLDSTDSTLSALLAAVPTDPTAALVLADYLEEHDDIRRRSQGELLRLAYTLTRTTDRDSAAEERLRDLLRGGVKAVGPFRRVPLADGVAIDFAWVPPGVFLMGSPDDEAGRAEEGDPRPRACLWSEGPRHAVTLTRGFWAGVTPVTQGQFAAVTGRNPSWSSRIEFDPEVDLGEREHPVQEVTWFDVAAFLRALSNRTANHFRLPTEAEWEYACRAGTTTRFWSGDSEDDLARVGWYAANAAGENNPMRPVGTKPANAFGLHDTHGNVWEWCSDVFAADYYSRSPGVDPRCTEGDRGYRVVRGGDAWDDAANCRSAARDDQGAPYSHNDIGFRVVANRL